MCSHVDLKIYFSQDDCIIIVFRVFVEQFGILCFEMHFINKVIPNFFEVWNM